MNSLQFALLLFVGHLAVVVFADKVEHCYDYEHDEEVVGAIKKCKEDHPDGKKDKIYVCELQQLQVINEKFEINMERTKELVERLAIPDKKQPIHDAIIACEDNEKNGQAFFKCMHKKLGGECVHQNLTPEDPEE